MSRADETKSIIILIDYFGSWPKWFALFLKSCQANSSVKWAITTDCPIPSIYPENVSFISTSFADYKRRASDILQLNFNPAHPYNICNIRPAFGVLHRDLIEGYDYYGWGDIDVVYGSIREFYGEHELTHDVLSTHDEICSGHLTLVRNEDWLRQAYLNIPNWRAVLEKADGFAWTESMSEVGFSSLFSPHEEKRRYFCELSGSDPDTPRLSTNTYFNEQWTTPFVPKPWLNGSMSHPETWHWENGHVSNLDDVGRRFIYLHLMNFKGKKWVNEEIYGDSETWSDVGELMDFSYSDIGDNRIRIDRRGIRIARGQGA